MLNAVYESCPHPLHCRWVRGACTTTLTCSVDAPVGAQRTYQVIPKGLGSHPNAGAHIPGGWHLHRRRLAVQPLIHTSAPTAPIYTSADKAATPLRVSLSVLPLPPKLSGSRPRLLACLLSLSVAGLDEHRC